MISEEEQTVTVGIDAREWLWLYIQTSHGDFVSARQREPEQFAEAEKSHVCLLLYEHELPLSVSLSDDLLQCNTISESVTLRLYTNAEELCVNL